MKKIAVVLLIVCVGLTIGWINKDTTSSSVMAAGQDAESIMGAAAHSLDGSGRNDGHEATRSSQVVLSGEQDAFAVVAAAKNASQAYRELLPRARRGDFAAIEAVHLLNRACFYLFRDTSHAPINDSPIDSKLFKMRQEAFSRRKNFCDDLASFQAVEQEFSGDSYRETESRAVELGDEVAISSKLSLSDASPESVDLAIHLASQTKKPGVLFNSIVAFAESDDPRIASINNRVFGRHDSSEYRGNVTGAAAMWAACMNGQPDCGPYSMEADSSCIYLGECYSNISRMDYLRTRVLSARQFEQMQLYLQLLNDEVLHRK